jgi:hypothetical protein
MKSLCASYEPKKKKYMHVCVEVGLKRLSIGYHKCRAEILARKKLVIWIRPKWIEF